MSRGLQMLVEEGERSSCAHAVRSVGSRNRPRFHQKTAKTANSVDGIIKKRKKLRFGAPRRAKNSENCVSGHPDGQKTAKTAFRGTPTDRKQQKPRFGAPRRTENSENCISQPWESQKHPKITFPNFGKIKITRFPRFPPRGKIKITRFLRFPLEGKTKSPKNCVSPRREKQNHFRLLIKG